MVSSVSAHTVPPFYACYFLRSYAGHGSRIGRTYIGSTPDPKRRKRQHNGDLTQGARRTTRGRPWEMEMIVYGFPSKIAALQFEWSWQMPHLTRHLRVLPSEANRPGVTQSAADLLLPGSTTRRTAKGRSVRVSLNDPRSKFIAMRALLASEPFALWGLKVAFFAEWAYDAWKTLEDSEIAFRIGESSRSGIKLAGPALSPAVTCCWKGVDGARHSVIDSMPQANEPARPASPKRAKGKGKAKDNPQSSGLAWPEALQVPKHAINSSTPLTRDDLDNAPIFQHANTAGHSAAASWFEFQDDVISNEEWARYQNVLHKHKVFELEDLLKKGSKAPCACCGKPVDLQDQMSFSLCASPHTSMHAVKRPIRIDDTDRHCGSVFHIECLADAFPSPSEDEDETALAVTAEPVVLPVAGKCPTCGPNAKTGLWADVVRSVFRRSDRMRAELEQRDKETAVLEKRRQKEEERQAALAEKKAAKEAAKKAGAAERDAVKQAKAQEKAAKRATAGKAKAAARSPSKPGLISDDTEESDDQRTEVAPAMPMPVSAVGAAFRPTAKQPSRPSKAAVPTHGLPIGAHTAGIIDLTQADVSSSSLL